MLRGDSVHVCMYVCMAEVHRQRIRLHVIQRQESYDYCSQSIGLAEWMVS